MSLSWPRTELSFGTRRIGRSSQNALRIKYIITFCNHVISSFYHGFLRDSYSTIAIFPRQIYDFFTFLDIAWTKKVAIESCPCLEINIVIGHISFPEDMAVRRYCVFPHDQTVLDVLNNLESPVLIEVVSSREIMVDGKKAAIIFDFEVVPSAHTPHVMPKFDHEGEDHVQMQFTPWLDLSLCTCNCNSPRHSGTVVIGLNSNQPSQPEDQTSNSDSEESVHNNSEGADIEDVDSDSEINDDQIQNRQLFSEYFALKGSSYHKDCQDALRKCKAKELNKDSISLRVFAEPDNPRDKNAFLVEVHLNEKWHRVGYIPKYKIRKVKSAVIKGEIQTIRFKAIGFMYIPDLNDWLYTPMILITKWNKWLATDPNYRYNNPIEI